MLSCFVYEVVRYNHTSPSPPPPSPLMCSEKNVLDWTGEGRHRSLKINSRFVPGIVSLYKDVSTWAMRLSSKFCIRLFYHVRVLISSDVLFIRWRTQQESDVEQYIIYFYSHCLCYRIKSEYILFFDVNMNWNLKSRCSSSYNGILAFHVSWGANTVQTLSLIHI